MSNGTLEFYLAGTSTATNLFSDNIGTSIGSSITLNSGGMPESGGNVITLFRDSAIAIKVVGKNASGAIIFTSDNLEDGLTILASTSNAKGASLISIEDVASHFAATQVEAALAELANDWLKKSKAGQTVTQSVIFSAGASFNDAKVHRLRLADTAWDSFTVSSSSGAATYDLIDGNAFETTLTENITSITIDNVINNNLVQITIKITQDGAGGAYTVTWPGSVEWSGGTAPTISTGNDAVDIITLQTWDGGTRWFGNYSQAFA
jgi:hypothetical protein